MQARFPRPTASCPFYSKPHVRTKLLPVVQLRSGVIVLMGDPYRLCWTDSEIVREYPSLIEEAVRGTLEELARSDLLTPRENPPRREHA
jgi:hypothetical protein